MLIGAGMCIVSSIRGRMPLQLAPLSRNVPLIFSTILLEEDPLFSVPPSTVDAKINLELEAGGCGGYNRGLTPDPDADETLALCALNIFVRLISHYRTLTAHPDTALAAFLAHVRIQVQC